MTGEMEVQLKILDDRLPGWGFPHWGSTLAAGLDLHACVSVPLEVAAGAPAILVPAGFAIRIGEGGWFGLVAPRSGLGHRGLVLGNAVGIIDADYEGEILISAWNRNGPGTPPIRIVPGDRVAQMVFVPAGRPGFHVVAEFSGTSGRGAGGFGSTGGHRDLR